MSRKHPLKESLSENIGPPTKRCRFDNHVNIRLIQPTDRHRNDSLTSSTDEEEFGQPNFRIIRNAGGKRKKPNNASVSTTVTDENDITELTRRFKKARIRPVFYTISTFVEQTVDDVQVTVGDDNENNQNGETENSDSEVSSTFTFILPSTPRPKNRSSSKANLKYDGSDSNETDFEGRSDYNGEYGQGGAEDTNSSTT